MLEVDVLLWLAGLYVLEGNASFFGLVQHDAIDVSGAIVTADNRVGAGFSYRALEDD